MRTIFAFFKGLFLNPRSMGAVFPSSEQLANKMAAYIDTAAEGYVLELGPGTGVITKAILKAGVPADKLICLELAPHFTSELRKQFPNITIIEGSAVHLSELVVPRPIHTIISGLPLRSLPKKDRNKILTEISKILTTNGRFIQFTYALHEDHHYDPENMTPIDAAIVWKNAPPARVNVFKKC